MKQAMTDEYYMRIALELAPRGMGKTTPNPMVGCVLVKDGEIVGRGWHDHLGGLHAEASALKNVAETAGAEAENLLRGATAYVTLEPCSHQGRQPPCAPALVRAGIGRCVCAIGDPNPKVAGRGFDILKNAGIDVTVGVLPAEAAWLNRGFFSLQTRQRPWVTLKAAISADGAMALDDGSSQWITGPEARTFAHMLRAENDAILTGSGTINHDDPELTVRHTEGISPRPIIVCSDVSKLSPSAKALHSDAIIFTLDKSNLESNPESEPETNSENNSEARSAKKNGAHGFEARVMSVPSCDGRPDLRAVLKAIADEGMARVLIEPGPTLSSEFIRLGLVDEYQIFVAPQFMGRAQTLTKTIKLPNMAEVIRFVTKKTTPVGKDLWIEGIDPTSEAWLKTLY